MAKIRVRRKPPSIQLISNDAEASLRQGMMHFLHVQAPVTASLKCKVEHEGRGVVEQLFIGPHSPSGFEDLLDGIVS